MLRRAENVVISHRPNWLTGRGWVWVSIGRKRYRLAKKTRAEVEANHEQARSFPMRLVRTQERNYWAFQDRFYWDNDGLNAEQVHALLITQQRRQRQRIERAQAVVAMDAAPAEVRRRGSIPDDLKQLVFIRDGGRCRHCKSRVELQFDHIIPWSKGGATSAENLQVLCGPCNRRKRDGLTIR